MSPTGPRENEEHQLSRLPMCPVPGRTLTEKGSPFLLVVVWRMWRMLYATLWRYEVAQTRIFRQEACVMNCFDQT